MMKTYKYKISRLNQFVFSKSQETFKQRRDKIVKRLSLNDFHNIREYNINFQ